MARAGHRRGGTARSRSESSPETRGWPRRGSRGLGASSGAFRAVWWTRPWASRRRGSTRGRCTRRGGRTTARSNSGEQSRANQGSDDQIKGPGRLLTSRRSAGTTGQRRRHMDATGRQWQSSGCARTGPVSAGQATQRGGGHTEGCPEQLTARRNLLRQRTGRGRDGDRRTGSGRRCAVAELSVHVGRARERARGFG
jgi:hypothetical protein